MFSACLFLRADRVHHQGVGGGNVRVRGHVACREDGARRAEHGGRLGALGSSGRWQRVVQPRAFPQAVAVDDVLSHGAAAGACLLFGGVVV